MAEYRYIVDDDHDLGQAYENDPDVLKVFDSNDTPHYYKIEAMNPQYHEYKVGEVVNLGSEDNPIYKIVYGIWRNAKCGNMIKDMLFFSDSIDLPEVSLGKYVVSFHKDGSDAVNEDRYSISGSLTQETKEYSFKATLVETTEDKVVYVGTIPTITPPDVPVIPPSVTPEDPSVPVPPTPDTPTTPGTPGTPDTPTTPDTPSTPGTPTTVAAAPADGAAVLGARREAGDTPAVLGARRGRTGDESKTASTRAAAMASAAAVIGLMGITRRKRED